MIRRDYLDEFENLVGCILESGTSPDELIDWIRWIADSYRNAESEAELPQ